MFPGGARGGNNPLGHVTLPTPPQPQIHTSMGSLERIKSRGEVGHGISGSIGADIRQTAVYDPVVG